MRLSAKSHERKQQRHNKSNLSSSCSCHNRLNMCLLSFFAYFLCKVPFLIELHVGSAIFSVPSAFWNTLLMKIWIARHLHDYEWWNLVNPQNKVPFMWWCFYLFRVSDCFCAITRFICLNFELSSKRCIFQTTYLIREALQPYESSFNALSNGGWNYFLVLVCIKLSQSQDPYPICCEMNFWTWWIVQVNQHRFYSRSSIFWVSFQIFSYIRYFTIA